METNKKTIIQESGSSSPTSVVHNLSPTKKVIVGIQFLFVAFGATVLVPLLVGLDPSTALFTAGIGTLLFHLVTKGKVPIFLGSSFAFIAPIVAATKMYGMPGTLGGLTGVALVYFAMAALVKWQGISFINKLFPPIVVGPVIMLIGLSLAHNGVDMAKTCWPLALIALGTAIVVTMFAKGLLKLIPIFAAILVGYICALIFFPELFVTDGVSKLEAIKAANWFALPKLQPIAFRWEAIVYMIPVAIAPVIEHIGDIYVVNTVAKKNFVEDPGLHRTLLGDGLACAVAGLLGGPPVTTYSEVTGAMSLTKITLPVVMRIAAITAVIFSMIGKVSAILGSIPQAILGGVMLLLFGTIASAGFTNLINNCVDMNKTRNVIIASLILTVGIGGAVLQAGEFSLNGIGLGAVVGVFLNLILPDTSK